MAVGCAPRQWQATPFTRIPGLANPQSVLVDQQAGYLYVSKSNQEAQGNGAGGTIARLQSPAKPNRPHWRPRSKNALLANPKGMCIFDGRLWVADGARLVGFPLGAGTRQSIQIPGAGELYDLATDGKAIYFCDIKLDTVSRWTPKAGVSSIMAPKGIRGLTFSDKSLYAVGGESADVYELDPSGQVEARAFGLAGRFSSLNSIEALGDGTLIVSDRVGGTITAISRDGKHVYPLIKTESPGDIGLDRGSMLLYVPLVKHDTVKVYRLEYGPLPAASKTAKPRSGSARY